MAIHTSLAALAEEAIEEYLQTLRSCLAYRKTDGGCLGYPAALLMLCLVSAFGTYLAGEEVIIDGKSQRITAGEPFRVLNHPLFGQHLTHDQIKRIEHAYRNRLAHNAMLDPLCLLIPGNEGAPFIFRTKTVGIVVGSLHNTIEKTWRSFDRSKIRQFVERQKQRGAALASKKRPK